MSDIVWFLNGAGVETFVVCPAPKPGPVPSRAERAEGSAAGNEARVTRLPVWRPLGFSPHLPSRATFYATFVLRAIPWCIRKARPDRVILTTTPPPTVAFVGLLAKKLTRARWILDYRDHWLNASVELGLVKRGGLIHRVGRLLEKLSLRECDSLFVVHQNMIDDLQATHGLPLAHKTRVVPNGVDTSLFEPRLVPKKKQLIYSGNLGMAHDFQTLLLAMPFVARRLGVKLLIVGEGDARRDLERTIQEVDLQGCVEVRQPVDRRRLVGIISESMLGVDAVKRLPSLDAAIPVKFLEYMACGVPFVGCGGSAMGRLAVESRAGLVVQNDPRELAAAICNLIEAPRELSMMAEAGRRFVMTNYDRRTITEGVQEEIRRLANVSAASG